MYSVPLLKFDLHTYYIYVHIQHMECYVCIVCPYFLHLVGSDKQVGSTGFRCPSGESQTQRLLSDLEESGDDGEGPHVLDNNRVFSFLLWGGRE